MSHAQRISNLTPGVAFITGGARGLGNAVAVSFAKHGAKAVVIVDIQDESTFATGKKEVEKYGTECLTIHADVTNEAGVEKAVAQAVKRFGRLDYAANFAGISGGPHKVSEISLEEFQKVMAVNSSGILLSTKFELRQMMEQQTIKVEDGRVPQLGSIVNCASINSIQAHVGSVAYTASKHAVVGISKVAALEGRKHGIRVNAISPGYLYTPMIAAAFNGTGEVGEARWKTFEDRQGRQATFDEIGDAVVLMSAPSMSLINGHNVVADNGFTINEGVA